MAIITRIILILALIVTCLKCWFLPPLLLLSLVYVKDIYQFLFSVTYFPFLVSMSVFCRWSFQLFLKLFLRFPLSPYLIEIAGSTVHFYRIRGKKFISLKRNMSQNIIKLTVINSVDLVRNKTKEHLIWEWQELQQTELWWCRRFCLISSICYKRKHSRI